MCWLNYEVIYCRYCAHQMRHYPYNGDGFTYQQRCETAIAADRFNACGTFVDGEQGQGVVRKHSWGDMHELCANCITLMPRDQASWTEADMNHWEYYKRGADNPPTHGTVPQVGGTRYWQG